MNVKDTEALIEYVGNHYPHMDVSLRNGTWVVETPDGSAGQGKRRFRRAVQKSKIRQDEEEHEDDDAADAHVQKLIGELGASRAIVHRRGTHGDCSGVAAMDDDLGIAGGGSQGSSWSLDGETLQALFE